MTNNAKNMGELLSEIMETRGLSAERLSELTNINKRYINGLLSNDLKSVPPAPYVRGYLLKIAEVMETDPDPLQEAYRDLELKTSGRNDRLPDNRFAIPRSKRSLVTVLVAVALSVVVIGIRWSSLMGIPVIEINIPEKIGERDYLETRDSSFIVEGSVDQKDSLFINNEPIPTDYDGKFSKEISLNEGLNTLEIRAERFLGKEKVIVRKLFYITPDESESENNPAENNAAEETIILPEEEINQVEF